LFEKSEKEGRGRKKKKREMKCNKCIANIFGSVIMWAFSSHARNAIDVPLLPREVLPQMFQRKLKKINTWGHQGRKISLW
jgi:hypothetical protein